MDYSVDGYDKDKFDAVWRRVAHRPGSVSPPAGPSGHAAAEGARLREFITGEACDAQFFTVLAGRVSGYGQRLLAQIAGDEKHHLKKLRARHFIITGQTYTPPSSCPLIRDVPGALRQKYEAEAVLARAYLESASETGYGDLSELYRALADDEMRHRKTIGCLIENLL